MRNNPKKKFLPDKGYITFVLFALVVFALLFAGSLATFPFEKPDTGTYILVTPSPYGNYKSLEMHTLEFITVSPTPNFNDLPCSGAVPNFANPGGGNNGGGGGGGSGGGPLPPPDNGGGKGGNNHHSSPTGKPCPTNTPAPT